MSRIEPPGRVKEVLGSGLKQHPPITTSTRFREKVREDCGANSTSA